MSNLGWYQTITTLSKKLGGPKNLCAIVLGSGIVIGYLVDEAKNAVKKKYSVKKDENRRIDDSKKIYTIAEDCCSNEGLKFNLGDRFRILERDGDVGLLERMDDSNNPYYVSLKFLSKVSDYKEL